MSFKSSCTCSCQVNTMICSFSGSLRSHYSQLLFIWLLFPFLCNSFCLCGAPFRQIDSADARTKQKKIEKRFLNLVGNSSIVHSIGGFYLGVIPRIFEKKTTAPTMKQVAAFLRLTQPTEEGTFNANSFH